MTSIADKNATGMEVSIACVTDVGRVRSANEDAFIVAELNDKGVKSITGDLDDSEVGPVGVLLAVADGMGGAQAGEVASGVAIAQLIGPRGAPAQKEAIADRPCG